MVNKASLLTVFYNQIMISSNILLIQLSFQLAVKWHLKDSDTLVYSYSLLKERLSTLQKTRAWLIRTTDVMRQMQKVKYPDRD